MQLKLLTILTVLYCALLFYASLMPFDLTLGPHITKSVNSFWNHWPFNPEARISGSDLVSNLALYFPLAWLITVNLQLRGTTATTSILLPFLFCSILSLCVELIQLTSLFRIASASDWLFNSISGLAGVTAGVFLGKNLWTATLKWLENLWKTRPVNIVALILIFLLTADAMVPFLPSIQLKEVKRSLVESHFDLLSGLAQHPWHWWLVIRGLVYAALTILLSSWENRYKKPVNRINALVLVGIFAFALETLKLLIVSRNMNVANIAISLSGGLIAILLGRFLADKLTSCRKIEIGIISLLIYLFYLAWTPFDFIWKLDQVYEASFSPIELLPFYHYAMGASLNHVRLFLQSILLQGLLIYLLRVRFGWFEGSGLKTVLAVLTTAFIGILQEGGQLFIPSRFTSMTDIYCFAIGGGLGAWIPRPVSHRLLTRPINENEE
ncbi:MAG: VanZ family protein [Desulfobia sp.]